MRDRLIELCENLILSCKSSLCDDCKHNNIDYPHCMSVHFADLLLANGVVLPPCKVGDTIYVISQMKDKRILPFVNEYEATYIQVGKRKCKVYHEVDGFIKIFLQDDFGKTVFLTREEAEAKLKEGKG